MNQAAVWLLTNTVPDVRHGGSALGSSVASDEFNDVSKNAGRYIGR